MTPPQIINLQRKILVDIPELLSYVQALAATVSEVAGHHFSVAFVSDARMKQLNDLFRGANKTTDVLSFPHEPEDFEPDKDNLGDIVISAEQAERQAKENGLSLDVEIKQLILHGVLHLCGYDHETDNGEMESRELELREFLGIS
jgi:probable rRNA maturation factor